MSRRKKNAEWDALLKANGVGGDVEHFHPMCGYLYADGSVVRWDVSNDYRTSLRRAIAGCFGSIAKRLRGTWDAAYHERGEPQAVLMAIADVRGRIIWRRKLDLTEAP